MQSQQSFNGGMLRTTYGFAAGVMSALGSKCRREEERVCRGQTQMTESVGACACAGDGDGAGAGNHGHLFSLFSNLHLFFCAYSCFFFFTLVSLLLFLLRPTRSTSSSKRRRSAGGGRRRPRSRRTRCRGSRGAFRRSSANRCPTYIRVQAFHFFGLCTRRSVFLLCSSALSWRSEW